MNFLFDPKLFLRSQCWVVAILLILHIAGRILRFGFGYDYAMGFVPWFNLNAEENVPTFYNALLLGFVALIAAMIAFRVYHSKEHGAFRWGGIGAVFFFLMLDEQFRIHEMLDAPVRDFFSTSGIFYYAWTVPYGLAVLILAALYLPFLRQWPRQLFRRAITAAAIYLGGALGLELVGSWIASSRGVMNMPYVFTATAEELFEFAGLILFAYSLLDYMRERWPAADSASGSGSKRHLLRAPSTAA